MTHINLISHWFDSTRVPANGFESYDLPTGKLEQNLNLHFSHCRVSVLIIILSRIPNKIVISMPDCT